MDEEESYTRKTNLPSDIDTVLQQRGNSYGPFNEHARIAQEMKNTMRSGRNWSHCNKEMKEALDMIAHKIGRIVNGDPRYKDSWTDLVGYASLVEKSLPN